MEQRGTLLYGSGRCLHRPRGQSRIRLKDRRVRLYFALNEEKMCIFPGNARIVSLNNVEECDTIKPNTGRNQSLENEISYKER